MTASERGAWTVDFSLALHNRTGKYFIGRDLLEDQERHIEGVRYGLASRGADPAARPAGLTARVLGRLLRWETELHLRWPGLPRRAAGARTLHLDPQTAVPLDLRPHDIVLCHDMGPITHPELFDEAVGALYRAAYARVAASRCRMVFVSRASRDAYVELYGAHPDMRVIYNPLRTEFEAIEGEPVPVVLQPFLLTVGSLGRRKNQLASIRAFERSGLAERGVSFVLCGANEAGAEDVRSLAERTPDVTALPYVSDAQLAWLYGNASGFVLVSRLEGFGVPVVEAIARGLVPLVSEHSVLEEVAGDGALTADPTDIDAIAAGLGGLVDMSDKERRRRRALLAQSITRFRRETFSREWSEALEG